MTSQVVQVYNLKDEEESHHLGRWIELMHSKGSPLKLENSSVVVYDFFLFLCSYKSFCVLLDSLTWFSLSNRVIHFDEHNVM